MVDNDYLLLAEDDEKPEYPDLYFMFDGVNTLVAMMNEWSEESDNGDEDDEDTNSGLALVIQDTDYWPDIYQSVRGFGQETAQELDNGNVLVAPISKKDTQNVIDAFTGIGFIVRKATDQDHDELIRELDKLGTIKGGESKNYPRGK